MHFSLEPDTEDYSFFDQAVGNFEHGLDSVLMDSIDTPEVDASFEEADAMPSCFSSGFLHSVSTISDTSRLQLDPNIKSCKLWCMASALILSVPQVGKMSVSRLICYFSSN